MTPPKSLAALTADAIRSSRQEAAMIHACQYDPRNDCAACRSEEDAMPEKTLPVFYTLPAYAVEEGMSTADGQDITEEASIYPDGLVAYNVYTPRSDDLAQDAENFEQQECRLDTVWERVELAVFGDTKVDGSEYPDALPFTPTAYNSTTGALPAHQEA